MCEPEPSTSDQIDGQFMKFSEFLRINIYKLAKTKIYPRRPMRWTRRVERFRQIYLAKKKLLYVNRMTGNREFLYRAMTDSKENFKNVMTEAQLASWRRFIDEDFLVNPWKVVYKLVSSKIHKKGVLASFREDNEIGFTATPYDSAGF